jgi:hypothetical protein
MRREVTSLKGVNDHHISNAKFPAAIITTHHAVLRGALEQ